MPYTIYCILSYGICYLVFAGRHYLFKATRETRPRSFYALFSVRDRYNLLHYSSLLKNTIVRQVALDK